MDNQGGLHPQTVDKDKLKTGGKEVGLVGAPIVSVNPVSSSKEDRQQKTPNKSKTVNDPFKILIGDYAGNANDDFVKLDAEGSRFIPAEPNQTLDELMSKLHEQVYELNRYYSITAKNKEGDEILEMVAIKETKHNQDGTVQLSGDDKPITGANFTHMRKRIQIRQYAVTSVTKGKEFDSDGALVIRVF